MNEKAKALCDKAILLYHISQMEKKGIITAEHAEKIILRIHEDYAA